MYITTSGIGHLIPGMSISPAAVRPGDKILLSGPIGDHGITILLARGELDLEADLRSDTRSVLPLVEALAEAVGAGVHWMRDPTRGGVATSLNELARDCGLGVLLSEDSIPGARRGARRVRVVGPGSAAYRERRTISRGGRGRTRPTLRLKLCGRRPAARRLH